MKQKTAKVRKERYWRCVVLNHKKKPRKLKKHYAQKYTIVTKPNLFHKLLWTRNIWAMYFLLSSKKGIIVNLLSIDVLFHSFEYWYNRTLEPRITNSINNKQLKSLNRIMWKLLHRFFCFFCCVFYVVK